MKTKYLIILIFFLFVLNLMLLLRIASLSQLSKSNRVRTNPISINSIPFFILNDLHGKFFSSNDITNDSSYILLIFFSLKDCPSCILEYRLWNKIHEIKNVRSYGIVRHADKNELKTWVENSGITFTVLHDIDSSVSNKFGISISPIKILINNEGNILMIDTNLYSSDQEKKFIEKVNKCLL